MFKKKGVYPSITGGGQEEPLEDETLQEEPDTSAKGDAAGEPEGRDFLPFSEDEDFFKETDFNESSRVEVTEEEDKEEEVSAFSDAVYEAPYDAEVEEPALEEKPGKNKKTPLLILLLVILGAYAAYTYILPQFTVETSAQKTIVAEKATQRIPIKKPPPPEPARQAQPIKTEAAKMVPEEAVTGQSDKSAKAATVSAKPTKESRVSAVNEAGKDEDRKDAPVVKVEAPAAPVPAVMPKVSPPMVPPIKIHVVKARLPVKEKGYFVQSGVFVFKNNLNTPKKKLESLGYSPRVEMGNKEVKMNRLTAGEWNNEADAKAAAARLKREGYDARVISVGSSSYSVLIGSYYYNGVAKEEKIILEAKGYDAKIVRMPINMKVYHLLVGPYETADEAARVEAALGSEGIKSAILQSP